MIIQYVGHRRSLWAGILRLMESLNEEEGQGCSLCSWLVKGQKVAWFRASEELYLAPGKRWSTINLGSSAWLLV